MRCESWVVAGFLPPDSLRSDPSIQIGIKIIRTILSMCTNSVGRLKEQVLLANSKRFEILLNPLKIFEEISERGCCWGGLICAVFRTRSTGQRTKTKAPKPRRAKCRRPLVSVPAAADFAAANIDHAAIATTPDHRVHTSLVVPLVGKSLFPRRQSIKFSKKPAHHFFCPILAGHVEGWGTFFPFRQEVDVSGSHLLPWRAEVFIPEGMIRR